MTKTTIPLPPSRETTAPLLDVAMPTIRSETTSGITVIRIALTKIVPAGSTIETIERANCASVELRRSPRPMPAASASNTRVVRDTRQSYGLERTFRNAVR